VPAGGDPIHPPAPDRQRAPQTSDGVQGDIAPWVPTAQRGKGTWTTRAAWQVSPGVTFEKFDLVDARGPIRGQLLRVDLDEPGIRLDYAGRPAIASTSPLLQTVLDDGAIAGVNGDFFDIGDTGAPLGVGLDRQHKLLHGVQSGWNCAFFIRGDGIADIDFLYASARITQRPDITIPTVNSPSVRQGGIGLYTERWGVLRDYRVTDGQKSKVRMIVVKNGVVTENKKWFPRYLDVKGKVLIGRDEGARTLRPLRPGTPLRIRARLDKRPQVAITGNVFLIRDGVKKAQDDRDLHPRTAIGIDRDTNTILLLVIDGRQDFSRGYTMVELARLMEELGAEEALNLDGGGSSTMVARRPNGKVQVLNSPSDGHQRSVPNGLEVFYTPPTAP
jgi:Phosphodiester glycosidase